MLPGCAWSSWERSGPGTRPARALHHGGLLLVRRCRHAARGGRRCRRCGVGLGSRVPLPLWGERPPTRNAVRLAFDHARIIDVARGRLQERLVDPTRLSPFEIVPARFTLTELQRVYEAVLGHKIDMRSFRARLVTRGLVEPVSRPRVKKTSGKRDTMQLYCFKPARSG